MTRTFCVALVAFCSLTLSACDDDGCFVASGCPEGTRGSQVTQPGASSRDPITIALAGYYTGQRNVPSEGSTQDVIVLATDQVVLSLVSASGLVDVVRPSYSGRAVTGSTSARPRDNATLPNGANQDIGTVRGMVTNSGLGAELLLDYFDLNDARIEITRDDNISTGIGASFTRLAGAFAGTWNTGDPLSFTIGNIGEISGTSSAGCEFGGTFAPALGAGINLYDLQLTSTCASSGIRIGLASLLPADSSNPQDRLFIIATGDTGYRAATLTRIRQLGGR